MHVKILEKKTLTMLYEAVGWLSRYVVGENSAVGLGAIACDHRYVLLVPVQQTDTVYSHTDWHVVVWLWLSHWGPPPPPLWQWFGGGSQGSNNPDAPPPTSHTPFLILPPSVVPPNKHTANKNGKLPCLHKCTVCTKHTIVLPSTDHRNSQKCCLLPVKKKERTNKKKKEKKDNCKKWIWL